MRNEKNLAQAEERVVSLEDVLKFWEDNPVAAAGIPHTPGSDEFYKAFEEAREIVEPGWLQKKVYKFHDYPGKRVLDVGCGNGFVLSRYARGGGPRMGH